MNSRSKKRRLSISEFITIVYKRSKIPIFYGIFGAIWIFFSDKAAAAIFRNTEILNQVQTYKGWFFILVTAVLLTLLVRRDQKSMEKLNDGLEDLVAEKTKELVKTNKELTKSLDVVVRNERMAALGGLVAGFSHEISTPIGNALVAATYLDESQKKGSAPEEDKVKILTESTVRNLEKAVSLVKALKSVSVKGYPGSETTYSLSEVIGDTIAAMENRLKPANIRVEIDVSEELGLLGDPGIIFQIITNLVDNSIIHGFSGNRGGGTIRIHASFSGGNALMEYSDDGIGLDENVRRRLFEPFFTTERNKGAAGIGMYVVYNAVTSGLKGRIETVEADRSGVRFLIDWPIDYRKR